MTRLTPEPEWTADALNAAIGPQAPAGLTREEKVLMLAEVFTALVDGRLPSRRAALFVGGGGRSWLEEGGELARDYWRVTKPKSHRTPSRIYRELGAHQDERQPFDGET